VSGNDPARPRIGILVVAYNAESTLAATLNRVPADFWERIAEVIVLDDASHDDTFARGQAWAQRLVQAPPELVVNRFQLGPHPFRDRDPLQPEPPVPRLRADVREAQEVERLRLALTLGCPGMGRAPRGAGCCPPARG